MKTIKDREPTVGDTILGIGTTLLAAALMLTAVLIPLLFVMAIIQQGAGDIVAGVLVLGGAVALAIYWFRRSRHVTPRGHRHRRRGSHFRSLPDASRGSYPLHEIDERKLASKNGFDRPVENSSE